MQNRPVGVKKKKDAVMLEVLLDTWAGQIWGEEAGEVRIF